MRRIFLAITIVSALAFLGCGGSQDQVKWVRGPMPADGNFDGVYQSDFGRLELTVSGTDVTGLYEDDGWSGRVEGEIKGNLLEFQWTQWNFDMQGKVRETNGNGIFQYVIEEVPVGTKTKSYHRLEGWWGYPKGDMANRWNGSKLSDRAKKRLQQYSPEQGEMNVEDASGFQDVGASDAPSAPAASEPEEEEEESGGEGFDIFE